MVQIWMPACRFSFQPQQGPEWLPEILEAIEDRMRHKLVLLTKDNGTDMQLSNLVYLKHAENIEGRLVPTWGPRTCSVCSKRRSPSHIPSEDLAWHTGLLHNGEKLFIHSPRHKALNQPPRYCVWSRRFPHLPVGGFTVRPRSETCVRPPGFRVQRGGVWSECPSR